MCPGKSSILGNTVNRTLRTTNKTSLAAAKFLGVPSSGLFFVAKELAEKTKCLDVL